MAKKQIAFDQESRNALRQGAQKLARAVKTTLGPKGRYAVIDRSWGGPNVTRDGAAVADDIDLVDPYENMGARLMRQAAEKTKDDAGDGTTTATVVAEGIFLEGLRNVVAGWNPMLIARGIRAAAKAVDDELVRMSKKIKGGEQIEAIATIAAKNDPQIGKMIADAMAKVGEDGVITIEEGKATETTVDVVDGMEFDRGYLSPHFVTDPEAMVAELEGPYILLMEEKISSLPKVLPVLEKVLQTGKPLLVIAEDVESEVLAALVVNKLRGNLRCAAVKAPGYGDRRKAMMGDIAVLTGGTAITKDLGLEPENITLRELGTARKVRITSEKTTITQGGGRKRAVEDRVAQIRKELENTDSDYDREKLQERLARLAGGVARINVGAPTETAVKERKGRVESALNATRAAVERGILPGGGVALLRASGVLQGIKMGAPEEQVGVEILGKALQAPMRQLAWNAGLEPSTVVRRVLREKGNHGYDLVREEYGDMVEFGVVDPTKVTQSALANAVSVAILLLTTEAVVTEIPKKEEKEGHGMGEMEDYDDY